MENQNIKISIILPNFNGEKYLKKALQSFVDQNYINKELIIVDGKSTDNSHEIINDFIEKNKNIKWIKEKDTGISNAFNIGLKFTSGDVIGFLGSDDLIYRNLFDNINYINSWSNFDSAYFNSYVFHINEKKCFLRHCPNLEINVYNLLTTGTIVAWQNMFFKKWIYEKYPLDENNRTCMDYELYLNICMNEKLLFIKSDSIGTINIFDNNISQDKDGSQKKEVISVANKYAKLINFKGNLVWSNSYKYKFTLKKIIKLFLK